MRGEEFGLEIIVYNHMGRLKAAKVTLQKSEQFAMKIVRAESTGNARYEQMPGVPNDYEETVLVSPLAHARLWKLSAIT